MAQFIEASSDDAGLMLFSGNKTASTINDLKQSVNNFIDSIGGSASDIAKYVKESFEDLNMGATFKRLQALRGNLDFSTSSDEITRLTTLEELQNATVRMQRYVMAHKKVRKLFLDNELNGYEGSYETIQEKGLGSDFYDYRRVTNGIVMTDVIKAKDEKKDDTVNVSATTYFEETFDDEIPLSMHEQFNVMSTWDTIDSVLESEDFTDFTLLEQTDLADDLFLA